MSATASAIGGLLAGPGFKLRGHYSRPSLSLNHNSALKARLVLALYAFEARAEAPRKRWPCASASQSAVSELTRLSVPFEAMSSALSQNSVSLTSVVKPWSETPSQSRSIRSRLACKSSRSESELHIRRSSCWLTHRILTARSQPWLCLWQL